MDKHLSATEAAQVLGISVSTLYSYVSRGLLQSISAQGVRSKRYAHGDVLRLAARNTDGKRAGKTAASAIDWGVPVLESRITHIADGTIRYRGRDALELAASDSLEQVAAILWGYPAADFFSAASLKSAPPDWVILQQALSRLPPLARAMALLPAIAPELEGAGKRSGRALLSSGALLMRVLAAALLGGAIDTQPLHMKIARAWNVPEDLENLVRAALVLSADHELNASTFTVRCVASTGAPLHAAVTAGIAALSGPRHGGEGLRVRAMLDAAARTDELEDFLTQRLRHPRAQPGFACALPGFGHPLYPAGDPRGARLLALLTGHAAQAAGVERILAVAATGESITGQKPNIDFGLAAMECAFGWPAGAAQTLFALGRCAGWIAHAVEQMADGNLIRPRARYVGTFDF